MKKILIISQGGEISTQRNTQGGDSHFEALEAFAASSVQSKGVTYDLISIDSDVTGVDSCGPRHCNILAEAIEHSYADYDGFFILRGTAYSDYVGASLAFSLQGNYKPILIGDAQVSLFSPISDAAALLNRGLLYLATEGQTEKRRSDISIISDGLIVRAVDATPFPDGSKRYYSRTGDHYPIENLSLASRQPVGTTCEPIRRLPINENYMVHHHDGLGTFGDQFSLMASLPMDALILSTTRHGQFSAMSDNAFDHIRDMGERGVPIILNNILVHSGVMNPALAVLGDNIVAGLTMSAPVALAKARFALSEAGGSFSEFKRIMHADIVGEIPDLNALVAAKRPDFSGRGARTRAVI